MYDKVLAAVNERLGELRKEGGIPKEQTAEEIAENENAFRFGFTNTSMRCLNNRRLGSNCEALRRSLITWLILLASSRWGILTIRSVRRRDCLRKCWRGLVMLAEGDRQHHRHRR